MLIRICDHFKDNPKRIDKLIAVKGLPEDWFFREGPEGKELKRPWQPDVEANIPMDIRHLCEPMYLIFRHPPIERGQKEIIEKRQVIGFKIDYNTEPGRQMWDDVERYIEESTPRSERIPVPVLCAKDERSSFETYTPRRTSRGSLELVPSQIPLVDLALYVQAPEIVKPVAPVAVEATPEPEPAAAEKQPEFRCEDCSYTHKSKQGVRMHATKKHPKKEKVGVP